MRVSIDASPLLLRSAGVKNYLYHWIVALGRTAGPHSLTAYPYFDHIGELHHDQSTLGRLATASRIALLLATNYGLIPNTRLPHRGARLLHVTNQIHRPVPGLALTTTLHDLTCWILPELHTPANIEADRRFAERIAAPADGLIAVSEHTRQDAIRILGLVPEKVVTIHSGVAEPFFHVTDADAAAVTRRLGLAKPFLLHIGTIEPRKNLDTLLDAYAALPPALRETYELLLVGPMGWASSETARRIQSNPPGVRYLGYLPEADLPALTRAATVFVYPSLYEGFGFPVAQAMAAGVPVVTSNTSCLPEITGPGALHVDPRSPAELTRALARLLESEALRRQIAAAGRDLAAERYRWDICARKSWEFFSRFAD